MKTLLLSIAVLLTVNALSIGINKVEVSDATFDSIMVASKTIYEAQTIINPVYEKSGKEYLTFDEIRNLLGAEKFKSFREALTVFQDQLLFYSELAGKYEHPDENVLKLKYGKRLSNLATYRDIRTDNADGVSITTYKLLSFY